MDFTTMSVDELTERRAAIAIECDADGADLDALLQEAEGIKAELEARKATEAKKAELRSVVASGAGDPMKTFKEEKKIMDIKELRSSEKYLNAFVKYLKTGKDTECRTLLSEIAPESAFTDATDTFVPVPTILDSMISESWERARIMSRIRHTYMRGVARFPFEVSSTGASVHQEGTEAPAAETLVLGTVNITPVTLKKWIKITDEVLALTGKAFLDYIWDEIEEKIYELADKSCVDTVLNADATANIDHVGVPEVTVTAIGATSIYAGLAQLADGATDPVAIMNKDTYYTDIMSAVDNNNRPIYNIVAENGRPAYFANGVEVIFNSNVPDDTIIVGDLRGMVANFPKGSDNVEIINDPYSLAEEDKVKIVGKLYAGIGLIKDKYFAKIVVSDQGFNA